MEDLDGQNTTSREQVARSEPAGEERDVAAESVTLEGGSIANATAVNITVNQGGIGQAKGESISVAGGGIGWAEGGTIQVSDGAIAIGRGAVVEAHDSLIGVMVARSADLHESPVLFLAAGQVGGDTRVLIDLKGAAMLGFMVGLVLGIMRFLAGRRKA